MPTSEPSYGTMNVDYMSTFAGRDNEGPMWALNLMKYREVAVYADGRESTVSGLEADNLYSPMAQLAAVGARMAFMAPVIGQTRGDRTTWDRIAVVRYPTRHAIVEMGEREDFQKQHEHKDAGMDRTIVVASFPEGEIPDRSRDVLGRDQRLLLQVVASPDAPDDALDLDATRFARFRVEGAIVGDGRTWAEARYDIIDAETAKRLLDAEPIHDENAYTIVMDPQINGLAASMGDTDA